MQSDSSAAGIRVIACDSVGSTNTEALAFAGRGEWGPLWIVARRQTAGRGRRGRSWISEPGNLYASLLLGDPSPPERAPQLSFVAALAVHDAVVEVTGLARSLAIKWPNDLLCDGAKLAGILIEGQAESVVIGIGINCAHHPADTPYPATNLAARGVPVSPQRMFDALAPAMLQRLAQWNRGAGFASIRADWLARAAGIGNEMHIVGAEQELAGSFEGLDHAGRLVLRLADGSTQAIAVGDVFPLALEAQ